MEVKTGTQEFLELTYRELEELNAAARAITDPVKARKEHSSYLAANHSIKAVTVCFSDIEGRLHILDYDKKFFLESADSLTFDGSSITGFATLDASDLRLMPDWLSLAFVPGDIFGAGKVIIFANILYRDGTQHPSDFRGVLQEYANALQKTDGIDIYMAPEIEGFLLKGVDAEQHYDSRQGFELVSSGGYFHSLPLDDLKLFIDKAAEVQRAMGFCNEKDHGEVAPSQFEINFRYTSAVRACDQILLYKLVCRQAAMSMGMTTTFLPKPVQGINGNGMHFNFSLAKNGKNIFYSKTGDDGLSKKGWDVIERILNRAPELCLLFNSSVNAYRRLDPNFEAPNQIKATANDRGSMIRIPYANEKSARIEIRSVAPDTNPYLALYALTRTGLEDAEPVIDNNKRPRVRFLPSTLHDAIRIFKASDYMTELLGEEAKQKYVEPKQEVADRAARNLGQRIKAGEVIYHHEVTNQGLWHSF